MTVVVGTAGHIDHGKTTLLRALTGIDADRLPEERRRGMTIDVGYAHLSLPDGRSIDFVDVPGHDRLVGNMLVGAGEIDAAMLVVAADDGPRGQTFEHLELLDALGIGLGLAVVTKADLVDASRVGEVVARVAELLEGASLAGAPVLAVSAVESGTSNANGGLDALREALVELDRRVRGVAGGVRGDGPGGDAAMKEDASRPVRLAIDRVFAVKGRGAVITGTLRGGSVARGATLRLVPGERPVRVRDLQVHGSAIAATGPGRTAVNIAGVDLADLGRGLVLTDDPAVRATDRLLVRLARPWPDRARARVHLGTAAVDGVVGRSGRDAIELPDGSPAAVVRLASPVAAAAGDRFVLRRATGPERIVGGVVLDVTPPRGISRRRQTPERVARLAVALGAVASAAVRPGGLEGATEPAEPGVPTGPSDRPDPAVPGVPAGLSDRAGPAVPGLPAGLSDRAGPAVPGLPAGPSDRADSAEPSASAGSTGPIQPAVPRSPAGQPVTAPPARDEAYEAAQLDLHGALLVPGGMRLAPDVAAAVDAAILHALEAAGPDGLSLPAARAAAGRALRRATSVDRARASDAAAEAVERLATHGRIVRDGPFVRSPGSVVRPTPDTDPVLAAAMDRLEALLDVAAPPALADAARAAGCPHAGIQALERSARIVVLEPDLAYAMRAYRDLTARALVMAARTALTPAAYRDATGTSRKYVIAILSDLDRRGILQRTPAGHVPGPRAPRPASPETARSEK